MIDIYEEIIRLRAKGESSALATVISTAGSTPREQGAKMLIRQDGSIVGTVGGSILEAQVREEAKAVLYEGKGKICSFDLTGQEKNGMICGGKVQVYIEPIVPASIIYIFGGGHISFFLSRLGKMCNFGIVVIDDREEYANAERFPEADRTISVDYRASFSEIHIDTSSYVVIVTRGHAHDQTVLEWALTTKAKYIGMIGSRKKIKTVYDNLLAASISEDELKRVHAPIGLDIKAQTPEEIAVSIMAEIIQIFRGEETPDKSAS